MKLVQINSRQFNEFSKTSKYSNFYQTGYYGELMKKEGFNDLYLVLEENGNYLCGGLFILEERKNSVGSIKYAYSPRGFVIDFFDIDLVKEFTKHLKKHFAKLNVSFIRIDPPINHKFRDDRGKIINNQPHNEEVIIALQSLGYEHLGFNQYFETLKPRWNSIIEKNNLTEIYNNFDSKTKEKINIAKDYELKLIEADKKNIKTFYDIIKKDHTRRIEYFQNMFEILENEDILHLYFVKLEPIVYLNKAKQNFENEENINNNLVERLHSGEDVLEEKIISDKRLADFKSEVNKGNTLVSNYPEGIVIGTALITKYNKEIYFMNEDYKKEFEYMGSKEFMRFGIIQNYNIANYYNYNLNGIPGDLEENPKYQKVFKDNQRAGAVVTEYLGEFDLIINLPLYNMFRVIPPLQQYLRK